LVHNRFASFEIMKFAVTFLTAASAVPQQPSFEEWAATQGINGNDLKGTYNANVEEIDRLNALNTTAVFGVNEYSGMTPDEFAATYANYKEPEDIDDSAFTRLEYSGSVAKSIDWVAKGGVTPVKSQHPCGSCWAHSVIATMESRHKILTGEDLILSEQHLMDCADDAHSKKGPCHGGYTNTAFYWLGNHTVCTRASYPYAHGKKSSCKKSCTSSHIRVSKLMQVDKTEKALKQAAYEQPIISVGIDASSIWFQLYFGGVYNVKSCSSTNLDHGVAVVGYGTTPVKGVSTDFWMVRNSWGKMWGMSGYIMISRNTLRVFLNVVSLQLPRLRQLLTAQTRNTREMRGRKTTEVSPEQFSKAY